MLLIGDCHGLIGQYRNIVEHLEGEGIHSILLGELGFKKEHDWFLNSSLSKHNKILFGNHDYFPYLNNPYSLGRFSEIPRYKMFAIAGGYSIDKQWRLEGRDWFREEEMTCTEEEACFKAYSRCKPEIVISHDGPNTIINEMFNYSYRFPNGERTNKFLDYLLQTHRPKLWVFAHHHKSKDKTLENTRFICLNELQTFKI